MNPVSPLAALDQIATRDALPTATQPTSPEGPASESAPPQIAPEAQKDNVPTFSIYLDESWPKTESEYGVLAGIVWTDRSPNSDILPIPRQHMRGIWDDREFHETAIEYLRRLQISPEPSPFSRKRPQAIPFIFRFRPPPHTSRNRAYEQMIHESLLMLLGWVIPGKLTNLPERIKVRVVCEAFAPSHPDNLQQTELFKGVLLQTARRVPQRFKRWEIQEVIWVQKSLENPGRFTPEERHRQGYLAYGDLLAYLMVGGESARAGRLAREFKLSSFYNLITFDSGFAKLLEDWFDGLLASPSVFLKTMGDNLDSPFMGRLLNHLKQLWRNHSGNHAALLGHLDFLYQQKVRDLHSLSRQFSVLQNVVGPLPSSASRRLILIEAGLQLQRANHFGDPASLGQLEETYAGLRKRALENGDADLVAHVDLNLAVRAADRFETDEAQRILNSLLAEEARLSVLSRAKAYSALGQILSIREQYSDAATALDLALELLDQADLSKEEKAADWDQTAIYRAFNAIDAQSPQAGEWVEEILQKSGFGEERTHQFRHHLKLRHLYSQRNLVDQRESYLNSASLELLDGHPWELIGLYRGLFAAELERMDEAERWFNKALEVACACEHGATLRFIASVIATVAWIKTNASHFRQIAVDIVDGRNATKTQSALKPLSEDLPAIASRLQILRTILLDREADATPRALALLPFNYR
jgi:tetratricopeptide (TPR) repeat protein